MDSEKIVLVKDEYREDSEFWNDVSKIADVLTKHDYDVLIRYDDVGVYCIQYAYNPDKKAEFGAERFMYVTEKEYEQIMMDRDSSTKNQNV